MNYEAQIDHIIAYTSIHWIAALFNGSRYDCLWNTSYLNLFIGNRWERHQKWLVTDNQCYITDLLEFSGCLDSTL